MRAGIVGDAKRTDDELAGTHALDRAADFLDNAAIFMAHRHGSGHFVQAAERPKIGPAYASGRQADDGIGRLQDFGLRNLLATHLARAVKHGGFHEVSPMCGGSLGA
jgi:hypothetical protein